MNHYMLPWLVNSAKRVYRNLQIGSSIVAISLKLNFNESILRLLCEVIAG